MTHDNVTDIVAIEWLKETIDSPDVKYITFVLDGDKWLARRFTRVPEMDALRAEADLATLRKQLENAREALEPSAATKYCYSGEFKQNIILRDEDGEEYSYPVTIEWTTIKEIMAAINARALKGQSC